MTLPDEPDESPRKIPLVFFATEGGSEPVREWLKTLERECRLAVGADLQRVQYRWPIGMPLCRSLGSGLWEVRTDLPDKTIARVIIYFHTGILFALHGFIKKAQKTPKADLRLALGRKNEVERG